MTVHTKKKYTGIFIFDKQKNLIIFTQFFFLFYTYFYTNKIMTIILFKPHYCIPPLTRPLLLKATPLKRPLLLKVTPLPGSLKILVELQLLKSRFWLNYNN
jgi:hypothetical protein